MVVKIFPSKTLVTLDILYYRPQSLLLQQFIWQLDDELPRYPRCHHFLNYWHDNIKAIIRQATIIDNCRNNIKRVNIYKDFT